MNAQVKIAGQNPGLQGPARVFAGSFPEARRTNSAPTRPTGRENERAVDDDARIDDWVDEGGATRS